MKLLKNGILAMLLFLSPALADIDKPKLRPTSVDRNCPTNANPMQCLACAIYHEARGENMDGQIAVGLVVLNRVSSGKFPNSICGVVWQKGYVKKIGKYIGQFSFTTDGASDYMKNPEAAATSLRVAMMAKTLHDDGGGKEFVGIGPDVLWYHVKGSSPKWSKRFRSVAKVGSHQFYAP